MYVARLVWESAGMRSRTSRKATSMAALRNRASRTSPINEIYTGKGHRYLTTVLESLFYKEITKARRRGLFYFLSANLMITKGSAEENTEGV
jgi:hypothetical protein